MERQQKINQVPGISIYPCLWFDGRAKEAATLYCSIFSQSTLKESTPMVVTFELKGKRFMSLNGGPQFKPNPSVSFFTICDSVAEIDRSWQALSENGKVLMALDRYPWSEKYGWVADRFGVSWQLSLASDKHAGADIFPSLMFVGAQNGNAEKAIGFYTSVFRNSAIDMIARYEPGENDIAGNVKYGQFTLNGYRLSVMDSSGPHTFSFSEGVSLVVECNDQEEIDYYWEKLAEGGKESMCGWLQDKFGVWWQIVPVILGELMSDPVKAPKVMEAFMKMKKFDVKALMKAAS